MRFINRLLPWAKIWGAVTVIALMLGVVADVFGIISFTERNSVDAQRNHSENVTNTSYHFNSTVEQPVKLVQASNQVEVATKSETPIVLVSSFENFTGVRAEVTIDGPKGPNNISRRTIVDRYTEAPRSILEDILLQIPGVQVVERQQLDKMLLESEYTRKSGLVDQNYVIKIGKQLGANTIVTGTILNVREQNNSFEGYEISTNSKTVIVDVRVRVIDIETGRLVYSKRLKGEKTMLMSNSGGTSNSDLAFAVLHDALSSLSETPSFINFFKETNN